MDEFMLQYNVMWRCYYDCVSTTISTAFHMPANSKKLGSIKSHLIIRNVRICTCLQQILDTASQAIHSRQHQRSAWISRIHISTSLWVSTIPSKMSMHTTDNTNREIQCNQPQLYPVGDKWSPSLIVISQDKRKWRGERMPDLDKQLHTF